MNGIAWNKNFAYFMGLFAANGSFYSDESGPRFELCDGTDVESELHFSEEIVMRAKDILEKSLSKKIKNPKKKGHQFILKFRCKELAKILQEDFKIMPGRKVRTIDIPKFYVNRHPYETLFWLGVMDMDGMVARETRKISLWSASSSLVSSFENFLQRKNVIFSHKERKIGDAKYFGAEVKSPFFWDYSKALGFSHPRKALWLERHLNGSFYSNYSIDKSIVNKNGKLNIEKIFCNKRVYVVDGKNLLQNYGILRKGNDNVPLEEFLGLLRRNSEYSEISNIISACRLKMSKGSTVSVKIPIEPDTKFWEYSKFVRVCAGGIRISKNYVRAFNKDPEDVIKYFTEVFGIEPKTTSKGEPLFCSGVLRNLFKNMLVRAE